MKLIIAYIVRYGGFTLLVMALMYLFGSLLWSLLHHPLDTFGGMIGVMFLLWLWFWAKHTIVNAKESHE